MNFYDKFRKLPKRLRTCNCCYSNLDLISTITFFASFLVTVTTVPIHSF